MLPFRTNVRGLAPSPPSRRYSILEFSRVADYKDIVEEALDLFRGNVYFANFEVKGPADRLLVVLTLYISRVGFIRLLSLISSVSRILSDVLLPMKVGEWLGISDRSSEPRSVCDQCEEDAYSGIFWLCTQSIIIPSQGFA